MSVMRAQPRSKHCAANRLPNESGMALITVLFLTILMTILGLTMVVSVNSDMMINGYYGNERASYYAADSGINIARQYVINQLYSSVAQTSCLGWGANAVAGCTAPPLNATTAATAALNSLQSAYAGGFAALNTSTASGSWPSSFMLYSNASCTTSVTPSGTTSTFANVNGSSLITSYAFSFSYTLCSVGRGAALQRTAVQESGTLTVNVHSQDIPPPTFAGYGAFINNYTPCSGYLVPGTFSGPTFTNGAWELGNSGAYIFTNHVGQANSQIDYWIGGNCNKSSASSYPGINVNFEQGLTLGEPAVPLPPNSYSQAWAAIDGIGCGEATGPACNGSSNGSLPTNAQLNSYMKDVNGNAYPATGTSSGVFLPYSGSTLGSGTTTGSAGGIYVQGNASVVLTPGTDGSGNLTQIYTITQGSTVTTVTTDPGANTTTISSGGTNKTLTGIPENLVSNPGSPTPGTMLYVNGTITGLKGPGQGVAAIQSNAMITIAGSSNIDITGDIIYTVEPVTLSAADTLTAAAANGYNASATNALGVFTASGNIQLSSSYANQNLEVDGSLAAIGQTGTGGCTSSTCGFTVSGSINTFNNVGGQIQSNIFGGNMNTENTFFDQRFTNWIAPGGGSFAPPWFPSITNNGSYTPQQPTIILSQQRTSWAWAPVQ
jgi:Tfp pilus assembly protein PilX